MLPKIYKDFYNALENTDVYFLMNEEKIDLFDLYISLLTHAAHKRENLGEPMYNMCYYFEV